MTAWLVYGLLDLGMWNINIFEYICECVLYDRPVFQVYQLSALKWDIISLTYSKEVAVGCWREWNRGLSVWKMVELVD
jgi:hypothetical protein